MLAVQDFPKTLYGLAQGHKTALDAGELRGDVEGLAEEALNLARPGDDQLIIFTQLVYAEDGDDILQVFVALQHALYLTRGVVMFLANDQRIQDAGSRSQRVNRRVNALLRDGALQGDGGIQVGEGCHGSRV